MTKRESDIGRLGGAWIAAAVGLSEYRSPLDAYQRITGEVVDVLEGEAIDRGNYLEPALREWHRKKLKAASPGLAVKITVPPTIHHREHHWASYTPDGIVQVDLQSMVGAEHRLAEYKSPGEMVAPKYGEPGTDQVPRDVGAQVHWGLFVTDLPQADVAALIGGELRLFHLKRDVEFERELFERARFFMEAYVAKKRAPPATYSERDTDWVRKRWPKHDEGKKLLWTQLTDEQKRLVNRYAEAYLLNKSVGRELQALENAVKTDVMQDAIVLEGDESAPFKRLDWKNNETAAPSWKAVAEGLHAVLRPLVQTIDGSPDNAELIFKTLVEMKTPKPPRVFTPRFRKDQK